MFFSAAGAACAGAVKPATGGAPSAPVYVNSGSLSPDVNATGATAAVSGTPSSGDILIAHVSIVNSNASVITAPSGEGWSLAVRRDGTGSSVSIAIYWKRWGSGSTDNTSIAFTGTLGNMRLVVSRVSGCIASGNPYTDAVGGGDGPDNTSLIAPTATGATNQLVMRFYTASPTSQSIDVPGVAAYETSAGVWTAGVDGACAASYATSSSNPTGTETATIAVQVSASKVAATVSLKAA